MTISEIYQQYPVHRGLQEHMIRVAAVAKLICDNLPGLVDTDDVVTACLVHDMGNLIKVKFDVAPALYEPEGVSYWHEQQTACIQTYGSDVHIATLAMIRNIGVTPAVERIVDEASFEEIVAVADEGSFESKILEYADMRVGLRGIVSLETRLQDIRDRYAPERFTAEEMNEKAAAARRIEMELFRDCRVKPDDITDASTENIQAELWGWLVQNSI